MVKRALLSVSDKTGIIAFAAALERLGVEIVATSGTAKVLADEGIKVKKVSETTGCPEILDGRVKTFHPAIHGGIMAMRNNPSHMRQLEELNIKPIDLVVTNLYPFKETVLKGNIELSEAIENIDVGGPALIRSSALNYRDVVVLVDPDDYGPVMGELERTRTVSIRTRYRLAYKAFSHTSHYDTLIQNYFRSKIGESDYPPIMTLTYEKVQDLRYGENPHQDASFYREIGPAVGCVSEAGQLGGKELSYNNINDANEAVELLKEFEEPTIVVVKNANPSSAGSGVNIPDAWEKAYSADKESIYGGIVAANREIDQKTASLISEVFLDVLIAPSYSIEATAILKERKNLRLLCLPNISKKIPEGSYDLKKVIGGLLIQSYDNILFKDPNLEVVTRKKPDEAQAEDLKFAMKVSKHTGSDSIVLVHDRQTVGIGQGQSSRINAVRIAVEKAGKRAKGSVMASDGFLAFADTLETAAKAGITAIIQPGGSQKDQEFIDVCDEYGITMIYSGIRHFKH